MGQMRDLIFSLIYDLGAPVILRRLRIRNREISILMFHRVCDEHDPLWPPLPIKTYRALMKELALKACVVPLENIEKVAQYPQKPLVVLSFDDGYRDFWENAVGVLAEFGLPAHHNICPGLIDSERPPWTQVLNKFLQYAADGDVQLPSGKTYRAVNKFSQRDFINICNDLSVLSNETRDAWVNSLLNKMPEGRITKLMDWDQVRECARLGVHIGSHGMRHLNVSKIEDKGALAEEIGGSRKRIYEEIGIEPAIFAFPNGLYNSFSMNIVEKSGYKIALLCDDLPVLYARNKDKSFYIFTRINIFRPNWKEEALRIAGFHEKLKGFIKIQ